MWSEVLLYMQISKYTNIHTYFEKANNTKMYDIVSGRFCVEQIIFHLEAEVRCTHWLQISWIPKNKVRSFG